MSVSIDKVLYAMQEPFQGSISIKEKDVVKLPNSDRDSYPWDIYVARHGEIVIIATAYSNRKITIQLA